MTNKNTIIIFSALAIILFIGLSTWAFVAYQNKQKTTPISQTTQPTQTSQPTESPSQEKSSDWKFTQKSTDEAGIPKTEVVFTSNGKVYPLGIHDGNCVDISNSSWEFLEGEVSGAICWFAGGGIELGVFRDDEGKLVMRKGYLSEGDDDRASTRGYFETLFEI